MGEGGRPIAAALPQLIYGTSFLGINDLDSEEVSLELLEYVLAQGITTVDTAELYPPLGEAGKSERIIARFVAKHPHVKVWTKTAVTGDWSGRGNLTRKMILDSARDSRQRLGVEIDTYFPHTPDPSTPYSESVAAFKEAKDEGVYTHLGLSNFSVDQTNAFVAALEQAGFPLPVTAQWQYNPLCRHIEKDLIPLYRSKGITFTAYSPLAGGFLTGKVTDKKTAKSRFDPEYFPPGKTLYVDVYDKPSFHAAFNVLRAAANKYGFSVPNASLRWLLHHSALGKGDGIILGATKFEQIKETLDELKVHNGPLPLEMVAAFDQAWDLVKNEHVIRHGMDS